MRRKKADLQTPPAKPHPPVDLWEKLEEVEREAVLTRPEGSFTINEYREHRGMTWSEARGALTRLEALGKVRRVKTPSRIYWFLC